MIFMVPLLRALESGMSAHAARRMPQRVSGFLAALLLGAQFLLHYCGWSNST